MEGNTFLDPAVAEIMKEHFVEARLHCDSQNHLSEAQFNANLKARDDIAGGTLTMPYFVVVDPSNDNEVVGEHELSGGPGAWKADWIEFLTWSLNETGRNK